MTITEQNIEKQSSEKKWWIEFDSANGKILKVSRKKPKVKKQNLLEQSDNDDLCKKIVGGIVKSSRCSMIQDIISGKWVLEQQKNELVIKNIDNKLSKIGANDPSFSDVRLTFYRKENCLRITLNLQNIRKSMNLADIYNVSTEDHTLMNVYLTQRGDPDFLVGVVEVDPILLFDRQSLLFDISDIMRIHNIEDLDVFTNPLFSKYNLEILDSIEIDKYINSNKKIIKQVFENTEDTCHININIENNSLKLQSNLDYDSDYRVLSRNTLDLMFFDGDVDNYCGMVSVPTKYLINKDFNGEFLVDFEIPHKPIMMFKDLDLVINYAGEQNE